MAGLIARLHPFKTAEARRLAVLFGVVYFAQGMWSLPAQTMTIVLKEHLALSAGQIATFFTISTVPWLIKPVYGLISDFVPFLGLHRKSYLLVTSALAAAAGLTLAVAATASYWRLAGLFTVMGLGLAFTDVMTDALMVETGRPRGLTGAFQSVQWASIYAASILVGVVGGYFAETRSLRGAFLLAACFPMISFVIGWLFIREAPAPADREAFWVTWAAIVAAVKERDLWLVAGFIFFFVFSPSLGTPLFYLQTDTLKFSQQFIGHLAALSAAGSVLGALIYAPLSRQARLRPLINLSIGLGVAGTLAYLAYGGPRSAILIDFTYGCTAMITQLAFLDLAAKACPRHVEGTFFALLMSVYNVGLQGSQVVGGYLYDWAGYTPLVLISAGMTALAWAFVPLVKIDRIEAKAREEAVPGPAPSPSSESRLSR
jgi:MFS family permease